MVKSRAAVNQFMDLVDEGKAHRHYLTMWPARWQVFNCQTPLTWTEIVFDQTSITLIPHLPGVYAFCIKPNIAFGLNVSYLMYIGETQNLNKRFKDYINEAIDTNGRPKVINLLNKYSGFLKFIYSITPGGAITKQIEDELLGAFIPPVNIKLPATVSRIVKAF